MVMKRSIGVNVLRAAAMAALYIAMPLRAADDVSAARELTIRQCSQCHTFEKGDKHGQGPNLYGLLGREAGSAPGFVYSDGFKEALKGQIWDTALLDRWLTDTLSVAPRAQMIYFQDDPKVRAKLVRYLESLQ